MAIHVDTAAAQPTAAHGDAARPRLLFFRARRGEELVPFMQAHRQQHVKCLSTWFDVVVIEEDGDYAAICERHRADLAMFEMLSGGEFRATEPLRLSNVHAHAQVPKLAFLNADSWCENRSGFYYDMDRYGIDTAVSICVTAPERMPDLRGRLIVWPSFIDADVLTDYGLPKSIPVLISGANNALYPWRQKVYARIQQAYPSLVCPHGGYANGPGAVRLLHGERYARTINASSFSPSCGTLARELVRKHLEIPAARACLITERTPAVEAAGFVDMVNCVFADDTDVLDKLDHLFAHPDELDRITTAGFQLVHGRHTLRQRSQVFEWYCLQRTKGPTEIIAQPHPFEPLRLVASDSNDVWTPLACRSLDLALLRDGDAALQSGRADRAYAMYLQAHEHIYWMPEPKLRLAWSRLHAGEPGAAIIWLQQVLRHTLDAYGAAEPDPVEWALFLAVLLCLGRIGEARTWAAAFPGLTHPQLDRMRLAVDALATGRTEVHLARATSRRYRGSVHDLPDLVGAGGGDELERMLLACGQRRLARRVADLRWHAGDVTAPPEAPRPTPPAGTNDRDRALTFIADLTREAKRAEERRPAKVAARVVRKVLDRAVPDAVRQRVKQLLNQQT